MTWVKWIRLRTFLRIFRHPLGLPNLTQVSVRANGKVGDNFIQGRSILEMSEEECTPLLRTLQEMQGRGLQEKANQSLQHHQGTDIPQRG